MRSRVVWFGTLLLAVLSTAAGARQAAIHRFERPVITDGAGPRRLEVDEDLLRHAGRFTRLERVQHRDGAHWRAVDGLADLRLVDPSGKDVPYLLVYPRSGDPEWHEGTILPIDPVRDKSSGFEVDLGSGAPVDALRVEGIPAPFLKRLILEGSGDRSRWTVLAQEATLFDLPQEALKQLTVPFTPGTYRYLRITWNDTNSGRVPQPRAARARAADARPPSPATSRLEAAVERRPSEPGRSRYRITLPAGGLPIVALTVTVGQGHVFRQAVVTESTLQGTTAVPVEIGRATLSRVVREAAIAEDLRIPIGRPRDTQLELLVEDGSNPPLDLQAISAELAELPWIYFEAPGGRVTARYGAAGLQAPRYDLEAVRPSLRIADVPEARWDPPASSAPDPSSSDPATPRPQPGPAIDLTGYRYARTLAASSGMTIVPLDALVLAHSRGVAGGFSDLRVVDASNRQVPYLLERLQEPLSLDVQVQSVASAVPDLKPQGRNLSVYGLTLPAEGLPAASVVLETSGRLFTRGVRIGVERPADRAHRAAWFQELAVSRWTHTDSTTQAAALSLPLPPTSEARLLLVVDEGDNSPLTLSRVRLLLPSWRVRFFAPEGPSRLVYGRPDQGPPQYDFELLASRVLGTAATEVQPGPEEAEGGGSLPGSAPSLISQRVFWIGLTVSVLILVALVVRLLRS